MKLYSQSYMADQLGISQGSYAKLEKGQTKIDIDRLCRISEILEVSIGYLMEDVVVKNGLVFNEANVKDDSEFNRDLLISNELDLLKLKVEKLYVELSELKSKMK